MPDDRCPIGNIPRFMNLDHSLNGYILHSLRFRWDLRRFVLKGKGDYEEEKTIFSYAKPREIAGGIKHIWESELGSTSSTQIIEYAYQLLDAL